jgi:hypothetical protein
MVLGILLNNCKISNSGLSGLTAFYPSNLEIRQSCLIDNNLYAISIMNEGAEVLLEGLEISGINRYGIRYFGNSPNPDLPLINDVHIEYYDGPNEPPPPFYGIEFGIDEIGYEPMGHITNVYIEGYEDGIHLGRSNEGITVGPNVICINNTIGIFLDNAWAEINGVNGVNDFECNKMCGLLSYYSSGKVRYSNFIGSPLCIDVEKNGDIIDFGMEDPNEEWGNNSIIADPEITEMLFYVNDCDFEYPALMNWWGSDEAQYIESMVSGCVLWDPFLTEPPEQPKPVFEEITLPANLTLSKAYPNPFNSQTTIRFIVPKSTMASVTIYNILGQEINRIYNRYTDAGEVSVIWDGKDNSGNAVASGIYLYAVRTDDEVKINKMLLLK